MVRQFPASVPVSCKTFPKDCGRWGWYVFGASILSVLAICLAIFALVQEQQRYREQVVEVAQHTARLFNQQITTSLDKIDMALLRINQELSIAVQGKETWQASGVQRILAQEKKQLDGILDIQFADAEGIVQLSASSVYPVAGKLRFPLEMSDEIQDGLLIRGPVWLSPEHRQVVLLSRRLQLQDGRFSGVVFALLPCEYFARMLGVEPIGSRGLAEVRTADMKAIYRVPVFSSDESQDVIPSDLEDALRISRISGGFLADGHDQVERYFAYRQIERYSLYVLVGLAPHEYFGKGRKNVIVTLLLTGLLLIIIWVAALLVVRVQVRLREDITQRMRIGNALELAIIERGGLLDELARKNDALAEANVTLEQKVVDRTLALQQANVELEMLARHDPLTRLHNRRCIDERLREEYVRMKRGSQHYALLLVDIDHFKCVNDQHGHETGDLVLKHVSAIMVHSCRSSDFLGRYGGEEFVALLPDTLHEQAMHVAEKIRSAVEQGVFSGVGGVTISIGLACSQSDDADEVMVLRRADRNLYQAKHNGRNQVADGSPYLIRAS